MDKNRYFQIRSGKYIKTKVADIQRLYSKWLWLVMAVYKPSFADAEPGENNTENIVRRNISGNLSQVRYGISNVYSQKIC